MAAKQPHQERQTIKSSRTMPQLHYTRQDIHEQYLVQPPNSRLAAQVSSAISGSDQSRGRTRAKSSDQSRQPLASNAEESAASSEFDSSLAETRLDGQLGAKRKRRRRAHSASLFSACFTIPSQLGSMLTSQSTHSCSSGQSGRRSLLAHLGLSGTNQGHQTGIERKPIRPISSSQTAGDLRSLATPEDTSAPGQPETAGRASRRDEQAGWRTKHVSFGSNEQRSLKQPQAKLAPMSSSGPTQSAGGSQILRNYQPRLALAVESSLPVPKCTGMFSTSSTPLGQTESTVSNPSDLCRHGRLEEKAQVEVSEMPALPPTTVGWHPSVPESITPSSSIYLVSRTEAPSPSQRSKFIQDKSNQTLAMTLYKRLPAVRMRTQATQTDITAYHLTPAASSLIASSHSLVSTRDEPTMRALPGPSQVDASDEWSAAEEEDADVGVGGEHAGLTNSCSVSPRSSPSSASSPVSLVGHDSTLLLTTSTKLEPNTSITANREAESLVLASPVIEELEIEPPGQFKDPNGRRRPIGPTAEPNPNPKLRGERMNMNGGDNGAQLQPVESSIASSSEWDDLRAPSPPSLSEASSQTEALMADLGRTLANVARPLGDKLAGLDPASSAPKAKQEPLKQARQVAREGSDLQPPTQDVPATSPLPPSPDVCPPSTMGCDPHFKPFGETDVIKDSAGQCDASDLLQASVSTPNDQDWTSTKTRAAAASPAELRRDEFLTLDATCTDLVHANQQTEQLRSAPVKRTSTSTLSARHHSYCSNDELDGLASSRRMSATNLELRSGYSASPPDSGPYSLVAEPIAECSLLQLDNGINDVNADQDRERDRHDDQNLVKTLLASVDTAPTETLGHQEVQLPTSDSHRATLSEEQGESPGDLASELAPIEGEAEMVVAANGPDNAQVGAIKPDCDHFMIAANSREDSSPYELVQRIAQEVAAPENIQLFAVGSSDQSGSCSGTSSLPSAAGKPDSPPTTVSELDLDEDISTPSFVFSYQSRLAQVCELADDICTSLLAECLRNAFEPADLDVQSGSSSCPRSSSSSSSTTSLSGRSYTCCHTKLEAHTVRRPQVPFKPAHLRPAGDESARVSAAAALVVVASSVAGGAAAAAAIQSSTDNETGATNKTQAVQEIKVAQRSHPSQHTEQDDPDAEDEAPQSGSVCSTVSVISKPIEVKRELEDQLVECIPLIASGNESTAKLHQEQSVSLQDNSNAPQSSPLELFTLSEVSEENSEGKVDQCEFPVDHLPIPDEDEEEARQTTEADLAQSEYTLQSQSETTNPALTLDSQSSIGNQNDANQQLAKLRQTRKLVDCPYVHDIQPLSPTPVSPQAIPNPSPARLMHDDTMEAIEDDVEGEEQEAVELLQLSHQGSPSSTIRSPVFEHELSRPGSRTGQTRLSRPASIVEEEESEAQVACSSVKQQEGEQQDDDDDEESSISISQHGVFVVQPSVGQHVHSSTSALACSSQVDLTELEDDQQTTPTRTCAPGKQLIDLDLGLDEPALDLEDSRPVKPSNDERDQLESSLECHPSSTDQPTLPMEDKQRENIPEMGTDHSLSGTGTIKRRANLRHLVRSEPTQDINEPLEGSTIMESDQNMLPAVMQRRGPPLSQLKPLETSTLGTQLSASGSFNDTSICSSCSCLDPAPDQLELAAADGSQQVSSSPKAKTNSSWMSQEEGTVVTDNYWLSHWLYVSEQEEAEIWRRAIDMGLGSSGRDTLTAHQDPQAAGMPKEMNETTSTVSEKNFCSKYKSTTRKMIHRRATIEMYRRQMSNSLKSEKRVEISRSNGEFGFRIHGSRPVVVSAIERGTSAETCGLQVGDVIYAINGTNILDMAHSDVVKLAHQAQGSALVLDLVPTNDFLRMSKYNRSTNGRHDPILTGFLMRLSSSTAQPLLIELQERMARLPGANAHHRANKLNQVMRLAWRQRYFVLRNDNCLYWYKSACDIEPHGGINLQGFSATLTNEFSEPNYVIRLVKYGGQPHYLGTNNICDIQTWIDAINKAATEANQNDPYMKQTLTLARGRPEAIVEADCHGYLYKFSQKRGGGAHWRAAYFVLKDACLYLFKDQQVETVCQASAVYYLHGYKVRSKHIESKKYTFELLPPNKKTIRPIFLMATNETDKKRWIAALEYSIDRWIEIA